MALHNICQPRDIRAGSGSAARHGPRLGLVEEFRRRSGTSVAAWPRADTVLSGTGIVLLRRHTLALQLSRVPRIIIAYAQTSTSLLLSDSCMNAERSLDELFRCPFTTRLRQAPPIFRKK